MNQRISAILLIALAVSLGATFLVYRTVVGRSSAPTPQTVMVIRAAHNLDIGALLKDADLVTGPWVGPVPAGMATKKDVLLGRGVVATIYEGEPIMDNRLAANGAGAGLAATIPAGMRAVAVRVNDIVGVAGFVLPGMRVDVLIAGLPPNAGAAAGGPEVKTVLQNIQVLSAGQTYQKDAEGKPLAVQVVNLLVTPEQAETLSLASNETRIQLVLRNPLDTENSKTSGTNVATLFGGPKPAPQPVMARPRAVAPAPKPPAVKPEITVPLAPLEIEVINGAQKTDAKFARPGGENK